MTEYIVTFKVIKRKSSMYWIEVYHVFEWTIYCKVETLEELYKEMKETRYEEGRMFWNYETTILNVISKPVVTQ